MQRGIAQRRGGNSAETATGRANRATPRCQDCCRVERNRSYFGQGPTPPNFIDTVTLERRPHRRKDASMVARVCEALSNIGCVMHRQRIGVTIVNDLQTSQCVGLQHESFVSTRTTRIGGETLHDGTARAWRVVVTKKSGTIH